MTPEAVQRIIAANRGRMIGKTRLQKSAYFLERLGAGFGFDFNYHYYGPYSEDLSTASDDAKALNLIDVDWEVSQSGTEYAIFEVKEPLPEPDDDTTLRERILWILGRYDATSLELAATADFLAQSGFSGDAWRETRSRKSLKATEDRIQKAGRLLAELERLRPGLFNWNRGSDMGQNHVV